MIICDEKLEKLTGKKKFNGSTEMEYFIKANLSDPDNPNQELVNFLKELANYEKSVTKNYFKFHAYRKAAGELAKFPEKIKSGAEAKELDGIGKTIAYKIDEFLQTGIFSKVERIRSELLDNQAQVSGIGDAGEF